MSHSPDDQTLTYRALGVDHPVSPVGVVMLINLTAMVLDHPDEAFDAQQKVANEIASVIAAKGGYGPDTEEPGDVMVIDVDAISWHDGNAVMRYRTSRELVEDAQGRIDWMVPDLEVPKSRLAELRDRYQQRILHGGTSAEATSLLHDIGRTLGWARGLGIDDH